MKNQNDGPEPQKNQDRTKEILLIAGAVILLIIIICFAVGGGLATIGIAEVMSQLDGIC